VAIIEIGGTTGDIEGLPFLESIRQYLLEAGESNAMLIHVTLVPFIKAAAQNRHRPHRVPAR
jgi:CTP synthase